MASKDYDAKELAKNSKTAKDNVVEANKAAEKLAENLGKAGAKAKDIKPGGGGTGGGGSGGGGPTNSNGQSMPGPMEISISLPKPGVGLGEFLGFAGGMLSGFGQFQPNVASSMQSAGRYYNASLMGGTGATRKGVAAATFGGLAGAITSQGSDAVVANILASSGMASTRGVYGQTVTAVANAARYLNMDNATAAQAISGLTSGMGSGNMLRQFGIYTSDLTTGKEKTQGQIFEELAQRLTSGRPGATVEETLDSLRRGNLGESLRNSGLTEQQQALFKQFMVSRAQGINMDLSDSDAMRSLAAQSSAAGNANPLTGMMQMESDQTYAQNAAQDNYITGVNGAAQSLRGLANAAAQLSQIIGVVNSFTQTVMGNQQVKGLTTMAGASIDLISSGIKAKESANPFLMDMSGNIAIGTGVAGLAITAGGLLHGAVAGAPPTNGTPMAPGMGGSGGMDILGAVNNVGSSSKPADPLNKLEVSTGFGEPAYGNSGEVLTESHRGIDYKASEGTPVYAVADGKVIELRDNWKQSMKGSTYGNYVRIDHGKNSKGKTVETVYAHLKSVAVANKEVVKKGQLIGKSGKTGRVSGPHLHYEVFVDGKSTNPDTVKDIGPQESSALTSAQMQSTSSMFSALSGLFSGNMDTMKSSLQSLMGLVTPSGTDFSLSNIPGTSGQTGGVGGAVPQPAPAVPGTPPKVEINVSVNGTEDEAMKFAKLVKAYLENNQLSSNMGSF